jgi:hypothetical protein
MMTKIFDSIRTGFNNHVNIKEKRPGIFQLILPIYHEDGDMIDLFIIPKEDLKYELCDFGLTLMRLSYSYEIDTENKEKIFQKILNEYNLFEERGNIKFDTKPETVFTDIMHITQAITKITSMRYFKREVIESMFYEILDEFIENDLQNYKPKKNILPLPDRDDLEADYQFTPNGYPVYLFGVKDTSKARLATISCLEYQRANLKFRSLIVHEDFDKLSKKDRTRLTNACDKQFTSLDEFKSHAIEFLEREK